MIIDGHAHLFSAKIIANVSAKTGLVNRLHLQTSHARGRTDISALREESRSAGVGACLILPTAGAADVRRINAASLALAAASEFLVTAGTLHPFCAANREELLWLRSQGVRAIKLCSFSQGFPLSVPETASLFQRVEEINGQGKERFFVILDTFYLAHEFFGTPKKYTTTPLMLGALVRSHPGIDFVAAHMGGLAAPPEEIVTHLPPSKNLYLDTSNAAHTLSESDFLRLLLIHGPEHIIFGTDWPWFGHREERAHLDRLLDRAGFAQGEKEQVFHRNIAGLLGLDATEKR